VSLAASRWTGISAHVGGLHGRTADHDNRLGTGHQRGRLSTCRTTMECPHDTNGSRTMTRTQTPPDPALLLDVVAQLFAAGSALTAALAVCGKNFPGCQALSDVATKLSVGLDWDTAWQDTTDVNHLNVLARELRFVYFSAVPAAHML